MSVRAMHTGNLEYQGVLDGVAANLWFETFVLNHSADIRNHQGNGGSASAIVPPAEGGCLSRFVFELHYEVADQGVVDALTDELDAAIVGNPTTPGTYATADCDSTTGTAGE